MSKTGWHDVGLTPAQFYICSGYQQWFLAKYNLDLSPGDGWRWHLLDGGLQVTAVEGDPRSPFPEPPVAQPSYIGPRASWDGLTWEPPTQQEVEDALVIGDGL